MEVGVGWGVGGVIYLSLLCHHQNDFCIKYQVLSRVCVKVDV